MTSLVVEGYADGEIAGSIGVRTEVSREDILAACGGPSPATSAFRGRSGRRPCPSDVLLRHFGSLHRTAGDLPSFRRQGMARRLLSAAEDLARDAGKKVRGPARHGQQPGALRLYEAEGYVEVSQQRSLIAAWFMDIREWLYLKKEL